jgi:hypothetical protein
MFRLKTAAERAANRASMRPKDARLDERSNELGEVYVYERLGKLYAVAFVGTAGRPSWHYRFSNEERRQARIAEFFAGLQDHAKRVSDRRKAASAYQHDVKVGDIFRSSWGYDQTNIDYYQVVRLIGSHMAEVREIGAQSEETAWQQGNCVPAPGVWATEADYSGAGKAYHAKHGHYPRVAKAAFRVKIQGQAGSEPYFKVASYANAYRMKPLAEIAGAKVYRASHWTAYH